jgi:hypothetical protein
MRRLESKPRGNLAPWRQHVAQEGGTDSWGRREARNEGRGGENQFPDRFLLILGNSSCSTIRRTEAWGRFIV